MPTPDLTRPLEAHGTSIFDVFSGALVASTKAEGNVDYTPPQEAYAAFFANAPALAQRAAILVALLARGVEVDERHPVLEELTELLADAGIDPERERLHAAARART